MFLVYHSHKSFKLTLVYIHLTLTASNKNFIENNKKEYNIEGNNCYLTLNRSKPYDLFD